MTKENNLGRLVDLATETSSERRRDLLREITDLFLTAPDSYSARENSYFGEIMGTIAFDLEQQIREELAEKLASEANAPHDLIRKLAHDEIAVARPVLEQSPVLEESDLIELAEQKGQGHLLAITKRPDITQAISSVLVKRGDDQVVGGLIGNETAQLSRETMEAVMVRAQTNESLHEPLSGRPDLPKDLLEDMVKFVSEGLKEKILAQVDPVDSVQLDEALKDVGEKITQQHAATQPKGPSKAELLIDNLAQNKKLNERVLIKFVRSQKVTEFICGLAKLANIDVPTAKHAIFNKNHEGLAIICKALDFDRSTFSIFVLATGSNKTRAIEDTYNMLRSYDRLTVETSQRILRFWRVRKNTSKSDGDAAAPPQAQQRVAQNASS